MTAELIEKIHSLLAECSTLSLATFSADGQLMACNLFFAAEPDLSLVFVSGARSRHSLNLMHTPRAAVTIYRPTWDWASIAGVQLEGEVQHLARGPLREAAWTRYKAKFDFVHKFADEVSRSEFYRFVPGWVRLIDNSAQFGYKEEVRLG